MSEDQPVYTVDPVGEEIRRLHNRDEYAELHQAAPRNARRGGLFPLEPLPSRTDTIIGPRSADQEQVPAAAERAAVPVAELVQAHYGTAVQTEPIRSDLPIIGQLVQRDLTERMALGLARYSTHLRPHNGRDALLDLYQELLDAACYARSLLYERDGR